MNRVIIAGTRHFDDYSFLEKKCDHFLQNVENIEIVCGECQGPDLLGKKYAKARGFGVKSFYPDWKEHGKKAGILRNQAMGDYANYAILFWDGVSLGTANMVWEASRRFLVTKIIMYLERKK